MTDKTFGTARADLSYREARGAYLIAIERGVLSVVYRDGGTYLPGDESTEGESHEDTLLRACMAQTGYDASVEDYIADADLYDGAGVHSVRSYFSGALIEQIAPPAIPTCRYGQIPLTDTDQLSLPIEKWAVEQCVEMLRADAHGSDDEDL
ncbi:MAG: hypothetical protein IJW16_04095 [Clostridia bacterium]|nr:hypothetical protein [Clostridia bacterium]